MGFEDPPPMMGKAYAIVDQAIVRESRQQK
jgi:hypothetical protein